MEDVAPCVWVIANTTWYIFNFRSRLISELLKKGYGVTVLSPADEYVDRVRALGTRHIHLELDNGGTNPFRDIPSLITLIRLFREEKPDVLLTFTPKVNIYGAISARLAGIPAIANISGLGTGFIRGGWLTTLIKQLYRLALRHPTIVFFQNQDDCVLFVKEGLVRESVVKCLPGSGVDVDRFIPQTRASAEGGFVFLMAARLLWDKGIGEYVEAARLVKREFPSVEFRIVGFLDAKNPTAISEEQVAAWEAERVIRYLGSTDEIVGYYASADCVVLPSYREGTPRSLLEAASMAKPIVTTDVPGCREVVDEGQTGFLCRVRDHLDLAEKMRRMVMLPEESRLRMGRKGREKMIRQFDERIVIGKYLEVVEEIVRRNIATDRK
jgi:glycosyltransferase involved in cell wall biosynthesis